MTETDPPAERVQSAGRRLTTITVDQIISSSSNLVIAVLAARGLDVASFGLFAIVLLVYVTAQGAFRALVGEPLLIHPVDAERRPGEAIGTGILLGAGLGALVLATGIVAAALGFRIGDGLIVLGACLPLLALQDLGRYLAFAIQRPSFALVLDVVWLVLVLAAVAVAFATDAQTITWFVSAWAGSGAVTGLLLFWRYRDHHVSLKLDWLRETWMFSWRYLVSFTSLQLSVLATSVAIGVIAGPAALGAIRGAWLLMGVFVQFQAAAIAAGVAEVSRLPVERSHLTPHVTRTTVLVTVAAALNMLVLLVLPDRLGRIVLGATWHATHPLLVAAGVDMLLLGLISGVRSALIGIKAVRTTVRIDVAATSVLGMCGAVTGAVIDGARGGFWGLAVSQAAIAVIWWTAYQRQLAGLPAVGAAAPSTSSAEAADLALGAMQEEAH